MVEVVKGDSGVLEEEVSPAVKAGFPAAQAGLVEPAEIQAAVESGEAEESGEAGEVAVVSVVASWVQLAVPMATPPWQSVCKLACTQSCHRPFQHTVRSPPLVEKLSYLHPLPAFRSTQLDVVSQDTHYSTGDSKRCRLVLQARIRQTRVSFRSWQRHSSSC